MHIALYLCLCPSSSHTWFQLDQIRACKKPTNKTKQNRFHISAAPVTLKFDQGHWNWHETLKLSNRYHQERFQMSYLIRLTSCRVSIHHLQSTEMYQLSCQSHRTKTKQLKCIVTTTQSLDNNRQGTACSFTCLMSLWS